MPMKFLPLILFFSLIAFGCETRPSTPPVNSGAPINQPPQTIPTPRPSQDQPTQPVTRPVEVNRPVVTYDLSLPETVRTNPNKAELVKVAVILPFSHTSARIKAEAEGIYNGLQMAMFDSDNENFMLLPLRSDGSVAGTRAKFNEAISQRARLVVGPLMSRNTVESTSIAARSGVPVLAFTNDATASQTGANLISLITEEEVRHMVQYAISQGVEGFGFFGPDTAYGRRVEASFRQQIMLAGRSYVAGDFYNPKEEIPSNAAELFVSKTVDYATASPRQFAVLIPDTGVKLRSVSTLLPYFGLNERNTIFMGTRIWNDPSVWREPVLTGGVFPLADPLNVDSWSKAYTRIFGQSPTRLASYGYDAGQLAISLFKNGQLDRTPLMGRTSISGVNGTYRFRPNRTAERNLAIMRITADGKTEIVSEAATEFPGTN